jgi:hypothetical protein
LSVALAVLLIALLVLFAIGLVRPWLGLLVLLAALPFNGLLVHVGGFELGLTGTSATMLAAWHDALAAGVIVAAGIRWLQVRPWKLGGVEVGVAVVLVLGVDSLVVSSHTTTALYAYRTLFEPIALMLAVVVLGRGSRMPENLPSRAALAIVISGVAASLFAFWQVYAGGFSFLAKYYLSDDGSLSFAYFAAQIRQTRAVGTFNSPNEFGAYLAIALCLLCSSVAVTSTRRRAWLAIPLGLALVLTMSRSGWLSTFFVLAIFVLLLPGKRVRAAGLWARLRAASTWRAFAPPLVVFALLGSAIVFTSGLPGFVGAMVTGRDASGAEHFSQITGILGGDIDRPGATTVPAAIATPAASVTPCPSVSAGQSPAPTASPEGSLAPGLRYVTVCGERSKGAHLEPFGMGLGAAGPKSGRFGEAPVVLNSEMWYLNYLWQAGAFGLLALLALAAIIIRKLWSGRRNVVSRSALAVMGGLAVGALFIPVLDEPAVAVPLWTLLAFGLLTAERSAPAADPLHSAS